MVYYYYFFISFLLESTGRDFMKKKTLFFISVVNIKEELEDAIPHVKMEPEMKPLLITEFGFNGADCSMDKINIKDEPLQDELVSEFYNKAFFQFLLA